MAIPSGSGTEVLKRSYLKAQDETEATLITGVANHIYTVVTIIVSDVGNISDSVFSFYIDFNLGGTNCYVLVDQSCVSKSTYISNDRFSITGTDKLHFKAYSAGSTASYDVWCTYIDQDWT